MMDEDLRDKGPLPEKPRRYRSLAELAAQDRAEESPLRRFEEFPPGADLPFGIPADGISRRRFLSLASASAALALGASACSRIDRGTIVPYTKRPGGTIPGVAVYYASTYQEGFHTDGVLVKTREGRPIHIEGNAEHPISRGKAGLRAVADLLGLYDPDRLRRPSAAGSPSTWDKAAEEIGRILRGARDAGKPVLLLTGAVVSPTRRALIGDLQKAIPTLRHAAWEPAVSYPEILADRALFGEFTLPRLRFDRADVVLSLQADFLGADANAADLIRDFAARRGISGPGDAMNRLWVIEGGLTLTGANADQRLQVRPSRIAALTFALARLLNEELGVPLPQGVSAEGLKPFAVDVLAGDLGVGAATLSALAADLKRAGKSSLALAGPALPREAHVACRLLNSMLGAEGFTVDTTLAAAGPEVLSLAGLRDLLHEAAQGTFAAAIFWGTNPAYSYPELSAWKSAVSKISACVRIGLYEDETGLDCLWRLPEHHWLEAWGDFEPAADALSLRQPVIGAIHNTRQGEDILLSWLPSLGVNAPRTFHEYLKDRWQREVYPAGSPVAFEEFWNAALHDGVLAVVAKPRPPRTLRAAAVSEALSAAAERRGAAGGLELMLLPDASVFDGRYANNGWLNELPNPVTKATWGNPLLISIADAERLGLKDEDVVTLAAGAASLEVPVIIQPGQAPGVASLCFGFGRRTGNVAAGVGVNAFALTDPSSSSPWLRGDVVIARTGRQQTVPRTQEHFRMEGRDLARSWTLAEYAGLAGAEGLKKDAEGLVSLIPAQQFGGHKWSMAIDLSACVGCSACRHRLPVGEQRPRRRA